MDAFAIGAGAAAVAGIAIGATAVIVTPHEDDAPKGALNRGEVQGNLIFGAPAALGLGFLGMTTDTPALYIAAGAALGLVAGGVIGQGISAIAHSRAQA